MGPGAGRRAPGPGAATGGSRMRARPPLANGSDIPARGRLPDIAWQAYDVAVRLRTQATAAS